MPHEKWYASKRFRLGRFWIESFMNKTHAQLTVEREWIVPKTKKEKKSENNKWKCITLRADYFFSEKFIFINQYKCKCTQWMRPHSINGPKECSWIIIIISFYCDREIWAQLIHRMMSYFLLLLLLLLPVGIRSQSIKSICFHSFRHTNRPLSRMNLSDKHSTHIHTHARRRVKDKMSRYQVSACDKFIEYARVEWELNGAIWFGIKWMFISETIYYSIEWA